MKLRLAWLADNEYGDSYSAKETRLVLSALARDKGIVPLWFAIDSQEPPHMWNGIRVFPVPSEHLRANGFLETLLAQQQPDVILTSVPAATLPSNLTGMDRKRIRWIHRMDPRDSAYDSCLTAADALLVGDQTALSSFQNSRLAPYIQGVCAATRPGENPTVVLDTIRAAVLDRRSNGRQCAQTQPHLVLRHQMFTNTSVAQAIFELANALIELGCSPVPQDELPIFLGQFIHREEELYRSGAPSKYQLFRECSQKCFDPETATTVHFSLFKAGEQYARCGSFPSLGGRQVLYTTGNHTVTAQGLKRLTETFEMVLAPSRHVLRPYLEAGLPPKFGAVVPHGIDPCVYSPEAEPYSYPTNKGFKFLQTSFPWVYEKGFDLTVKAFATAFSNRDDVCLVIRVPKVRDSAIRKTSIERLESLMKTELAKSGTPEMLLLESDMALNRRGGVYTGANCYVHPLRAEGFGMTILEAMACGLPVIATPWSGSADFLSPRWAYTLRHSGLIPEKSKDGSIIRYHVEPELDHLIHLMRCAYRNRDESIALGQVASLTARTHWTWTHAARMLIRALSLSASANHGPLA